MTGIVWLASYPKAGNTWFRVLLAHLRRDRPRPDTLDSLGAVIASARSWIDTAAGLEASDLTADEIDALRPAVYARAAAASRAPEPRLHKIHDAFTTPADGRPVIPVDATRGAIYFVRNPLDVAVSLAHHSASDVDTAIARMANDGHALCRRTDRLQNQVRQHLSSWSSHARGWIDNGQVPVHVVRYEDMIEAPAATAAAALRFAGVERTSAEIERAVEASRFERLQALERAEGFGERPSADRPFFRRGIAGAWRDELSAEQAARVIRDHHEMMRRLGYLEDRAS